MSEQQIPPSIVMQTHPSLTPTSEARVLAVGDVDVFQPVAVTPPPGQIPTRGDHPAPRLGISPQNRPLQTNKFYANLFLGGQSNSVWTHPYSVSWSKGGGNARSWGLAISHTEASLRAYGPQNSAIPGSPVQYFINPLGIQSLLLSATELQSSTVLTTDSLEEFSVNANLQPSAGSPSSIKFPLVQGMAFVSGVYSNLQPAVQSGVFFQSVNAAGSPRPGVYKYRIALADGHSWLMYAMPTNDTAPAFDLVSNTLLRGPAGWSGVVQVAKNPGGAVGEAIIDGSAGVYAVNAQISGIANGKTGTYRLSWTKLGVHTEQPLLMFALPHHLSSFDAQTSARVQSSISLQTTTKGMAQAVVADGWTLVEPALPVDMGFAPWTPSRGVTMAYSSSAISTILAAATSELNQDMGAQSNLNSMYYAGKALSKFATIVFTVNDICRDQNLAAQGLAKLKAAYSLFASNRQQFPLVYETAWKGLASSASYTTGDAGADFGNTYYNDHHFHYGYFIHAASVIAYLDPAWAGADGNREWVNALVRDVANPSTQDGYFPVFRSFDWYHGHSWAKGLFDSGDGKDEESSSEDVMFAYALKMWGRAVGDASMEARGNLMLAVLARSLQSYMLLDSGNTVQPPNFIGNKVTGIIRPDGLTSPRLFENKIDHTTYFGGNFEFVQGIHMLPLIPASTLVRTRRFVGEEWDAYFADGAVDPARNVSGGWKGILYANLAIVNPVASYNFFNQSGFDPAWLDGGASRTWYLAFAAGMGGAA